MKVLNKTSSEFHRIQTSKLEESCANFLSDTSTILISHEDCIFFNNGNSWCKYCFC